MWWLCHRTINCCRSELARSCIFYGAFFHHLSENYVDLSDIYVYLLVIYVDFSDHYIDLSRKSVQLEAEYLVFIVSSSCQFDIWQVDIVFWQVDIIFWKVHIMIWQVDVITYSRLSKQLCQLVRCYVDLSDNVVAICLALIGQEHVFKIYSLVIKISDKST